MPTFRVKLVPGHGPQTFVRAVTGNVCVYYRETTVEARSKKEATDIAVARNSQYSGAAYARIAPQACARILADVLTDPAVAEHNQRAEYHTRVGAAVAAGAIEQLDPSLGLVPVEGYGLPGDPRPYKVESVEQVKS